jgi:truncated hemoglobin YjbI
MFVQLFFAFFCVANCATSFCDKYSQALGLSNNKLVTTVVTGVVGKITAPGVNTLKYFDGTKPQGSTNFLDAKNSGDLTALVGSLVQFFGSALGCTDGTIQPYTGPSMDKIHQPMGINAAESKFFNEQVIAVLAGAGVSTEDQAGARKLLGTLDKQIISQSFCDRYSDALKVSNKDLLTSVVTKVFGKITAPSTPTLKFFNGVQPPGSTDYLGRNKDALPGLVNGLVTFFGKALGCHDMTVAPYGGPSMKQVHGTMGVNTAAFNFFNFRVIDVLRAAGVAQADLNAVHGVLNSTKNDIVSA